MLPAFQVERPTTLEAAVGLLAEDSVAYCGGTELLLAMKMGLLRPLRLVDLKGVPELRIVRQEDSCLVVGSAVCHDELSGSPEVRGLVPLLAEVEGRVGNARVRAQGSIGGNLCFAEPRSDLVATLIALDATLTLASTSASRCVSVAEFVLGAYWTARRDDELLVDVRIPLPARRGVYLKFQTSERPVVGVAAVTLPESGTARVVVGAVSDIPTVVEAVPAELDGHEVAQALDLVSDASGSQRYKRHITALYIAKALSALHSGRSDD